MSNVVPDNTTPPAPKNPDINPVPGGMIANYTSYTDWNTTRTWLSNIRDWVGGYVSNFFRQLGNSSPPSPATGLSLHYTDTAGRAWKSENGRGYRPLSYDYDAREFGVLTEASPSADVVNVATLEAAETFAETQIGLGFQCRIVVPYEGQGPLYITDGALGTGLGFRVRGNSASAPQWTSSAGFGAFDDCCTLKWNGSAGATMVYFESFNKGQWSGINVLGNNIAGVAMQAGGQVWGHPSEPAASAGFHFHDFTCGLVKLGGAGAYGAFLVGSAPYMGATNQSSDCRWTNVDFYGEDPGAPGFTFAGMQAYGWSTADGGNTKNFDLDRCNFLFCNIGWGADSGYANLISCSWADVRQDIISGSINLSVIGSDTECGDVDDFVFIGNAGGGLGVSQIFVTGCQVIAFQAGSVGKMIDGGMKLTLLNNILYNSNFSVSGDPTHPNPFKILTGAGPGEHSSLFSSGNWFVGCPTPWAPFYNVTGSLAPILATYGGENPFRVVSVNDAAGTANDEMVPLQDFNSNITRFYGLNFNGPFGMSYTTFSTATNKAILNIDATSGNIVASLPSPGSTDPATVWVCKSDTTAHTVTAGGIALSAQYDAVMLAWNGSTWVPIGYPVSITPLFLGTKRFNGQVGFNVAPSYTVEVAGASIGGALLLLNGASIGTDTILYVAGPVSGGSLPNFVYMSASAAGVIGYTFRNGNTASSAANAQVIVSVAGASSGDPSFGWSVEGVNDWALGIDNDDSQSLKLANSNVLGSGVGFDAFRVDFTTLDFKLITGKFSTLSTDSSGSPGPATINTASGRSAIASGSSSVTITNSQCTSSAQKLVLMPHAPDTAAPILGYATGSGSFVVTCYNPSGVATNAAGNIIFDWELRGL